LISEPYVSASFAAVCRKLADIYFLLEAVLGVLLLVWPLFPLAYSVARVAIRSLVPSWVGAVVTSVGWVVISVAGWVSGMVVSATVGMAVGAVVAVVLTGFARQPESSNAKSAAVYTI